MHYSFGSTWCLPFSVRLGRLCSLQEEYQCYSTYARRESVARPNSFFFAQASRTWEVRPKPYVKLHFERLLCPPRFSSLTNGFGDPAPFQFQKAALCGSCLWYFVRKIPYGRLDRGLLMAFDSICRQTHGCGMVFLGADCLPFGDNSLGLRFFPPRIPILLPKCYNFRHVNHACFLVSFFRRNRPIFRRICRKARILSCLRGQVRFTGPLRTHLLWLSGSP